MATISYILRSFIHEVQQFGDAVLPPYGNATVSTITQAMVDAVSLRKIQISTVSKTLNPEDLGLDSALDDPVEIPTDVTGLPAGTNKFGVQTPVFSNETGISGTPPAAPFVSAIETVTSDGDGTGNATQDWAGNAKGLAVRMTDGTIFMVYIQKNSGTNRFRLMRSPTGGPNGGAWTQIATVATDALKAILMRDRSKNQVVLLTCEGSSLNYQIRLRRYDTAGTQVGSTFSCNGAGKGIARMLTSSGFYYEANIGPTGRVCLAGWTLPLTTTIQANTTLSCYKQVQWILPNDDEAVPLASKGDGTGWYAETTKQFFTGPRADYDSIFVGPDGDPDMVYGVMQGNVAMWEGLSTYLQERLSPNRLYPITAYAFDRFGIWWHNRRTGDHGFKWTSPPIPWMIRPWDGTGGNYVAANDIPEVRTKHAIMNLRTGDLWIPYHVNKPVPYTPGFTCTATIDGNEVNVTAIAGGAAIDIGATFTAHSQAPQGFLECKVIAQKTGTAGSTGIYIIDCMQTIASSGTLSGCSKAWPSQTAAASMQHRVQIVTRRGEVIWDGEVTNGVGYGNLMLAQNAQGRVWATFLARSESTPGIGQTQLHIWELVQDSDGGLTQTTLSAANCFNGNNAPVSGNVGFGLWSTYLGLPQTLPARSSNQAPIQVDVHYGSRPLINGFQFLVSRRATDHNGSGTATSTGDSTGHKMDLVTVAVPT